MYGWLWRKLPGRWPVKLLEALVLTAAICLLLVAVVFPWIEPKLPFSENTVDGSGGSSSTTDPGATAPGSTAPGSTTATPTAAATVPSSSPKPTKSGRGTNRSGGNSNGNDNSDDSSATADDLAGE